LGIQLIVSLVSLVGVLATAIVAFKVRNSIHEVHLTLNSRLDQWRKETSEAAIAAALAAYKEGVQAGKGGLIVKEKDVT
jgi:uncharacterized membrane protein